MESTQQQSVLIFQINDTRFGLDATKVLESVWLPELTPIEEAPHWIVGMFNLRGHIVPVVDLNLRFGHPARPLSLNDQVIVLKTDAETIGLIVSEVLEVIELSPDAIASSPHFEQIHHRLDHLATGIAGIDDDLVTLIDIPKLTKDVETLTLDEGSEITALNKAPYAELDAEVRARFRARTMALRKAAGDEDMPLLGLAVVELSGEYFGIELTAVQEFCNIHQLSPIPCCPHHILGAMSLRGKLLTLIDPCRALNLSPSSQYQKAVITRVSARPGSDLEDHLIGVAVDDVHDAVYLCNEALHEPPSALREQCGSEIMATASYAGKIMTVLDLPTLLARAEWIVDENV